MDLVLFGIQGSGKGTQAKKLVAEFGYYLFEAGGELRKMAASGTDLGNTVKSYIDRGDLVPFEIIMEVVRMAVIAVPQGKRILFDGIPRDLDQMKSFDAIMQATGRDFRCIHITLDKQKAVQRILGRAKIENRADDASEESILRRMDLFLQKTMPVIEQYKQLGKVIEIDGDRGVEEVYQELKRTVK